MPQYITRQDIIDTIGENDFTVLSDRDGDGSADDGVIDRAIAAAEVVANSFVGNRYSLPLPGIVDEDDPTANTVPAMLVMACVDIAVYRLASDAGRMTEQIKDRYSDSIKWLTKLVARQVTLGVREDATPPTLHGGVFRTGPDRVMTREGLKRLL
jgi:phage gp36-like protein